MDKLIDFEASHARYIARIKELTDNDNHSGDEFAHLANWLRFTDVPASEFMIGGGSDRLDSSEGFCNFISSLLLSLPKPNKLYSFAVFDERPRICYLPSRVLDVTVLSDYLDPDEQDSWEAYYDLSLITFLPDAYAFTKAVEDRYLRNSKKEFIRYAGVHGVSTACAHFQERPVFSESWVTELADDIAESAEFYAQQKTARSVA